MNELPPMSWVRYVGYDNPEWEEGIPFEKGQDYLFMGEIHDQPGHGVFRLEDGTISAGHHTDRFVYENRSLEIEIDLTEFMEENE